MTRVHPAERKGQVKVVDLAAAPQGPVAVAMGPPHRKVLSFLRDRGQTTQAELLACFPELGRRKLQATVEDLVRLGKAKVRWSSPFRFEVQTPGPERRASPPRVPALA